MNRRRYLTAVSAAAAFGLAGCTGGTGGSPDRTPPVSTPNGFTLPVPSDQLRRGAPKDAIPAITDPVFGESWEGIEMRVRSNFIGEYTARPRLEPTDRVIGVERGGETRAYPLKILNWHEIVNDDFDGPLLVTFCPLCGSGLTAERTVDGAATNFGVSGLLWNSDLVMYDFKTESLWSQLLATAISGERTGETLTLTPSTLTTWGEWTTTHPDTVVLLPPPKSGTINGPTTRDYGIDPYSSYASSDQIGIGFNDFDDDRLHPKTLVIGITDGAMARAYPFEVVDASGVVNDTVGSRAVVVATLADGTLVAYDRTVGDETLTFEVGAPGEMRGGGSRWRLGTGVALDGPHESTRLTRANDASPMFWFAWADFNPATDIFEG
ncbi:MULTISPECIES: DUF3179 domain-containing protein [unclassified Haladaptatus]|uniref:DUF3179 domain-containing protein n=1 Tax=unclassified Haladaptatus TaxID=2622732 RepID=UPI0023E85136|nr:MULTISPECIES: DUF3179 domain-containing protein [unclassified Haladaptatus]